MKVAKSWALSPADAVAAGAAGVGVEGFQPQSLGTTPVVRTYGDLPHEFTEGAKFSGASAFSDDIIVTGGTLVAGARAQNAWATLLPSSLPVVQARQSRQFREGHAWVVQWRCAVAMTRAPVRF
jgi:hypothetical protein